MARHKGYGEEQSFLDEDVFNVLLQKSGMTMEQIAKESGYSSQNQEDQPRKHKGLPANAGTVPGAWR